jgi:hypothetical protein
VANEGNAFKLSLQIAATIEGAPIERAHDAVVVNQTHHRYGMYWTLAQEPENFRGIAVRQAFDLDRLYGG